VAVMVVAVMVCSRHCRILFVIVLYFLFISLALLTSLLTSQYFNAFTLNNLQFKIYNAVAVVVVVIVSVVVGVMKSSVDQVIEHACNEHSVSLNLSHLEITVVPMSLRKAKHLVRLQLNNNRLIMPPEELGELDQLQELSLDHNQLTVLPSSLFHLVHLTYLNVSYNPLGCTTYLLTTIVTV